MNTRSAPTETSSKVPSARGLRDLLGVLHHVADAFHPRDRGEVRQHLAHDGADSRGPVEQAQDPAAPSLDPQHGGRVQGAAGGGPRGSPYLTFPGAGSGAQQPHVQHPDAVVAGDRPPPLGRAEQPVVSDQVPVAWRQDPSRGLCCFPVTAPDRAVSTRRSVAQSFREPVRRASRRVAVAARATSRSRGPWPRLLRQAMAKSMATPRWTRNHRRRWS